MIPMILGMIVSIGLSAVARALQKKDRSKNENEATAWNATTTQRAGIPIDYAIGTVPVNGNAITANTTITNTTEELSWVLAIILEGLDAGEENLVVRRTTEAIAARLAFCDGPVKGLIAAKSRINDELLADLTEVTLTERRGTSNQTATPMAEHYEESLDNEVVPGTPVTVTMPDKDYVGLVLEVSAKQGLYQFGESTGKVNVQIMGVKIEIRAVGGAWHTLFDYYLLGKTTNPVSWRFAADGSYAGGTPFTVVQGTQHEWRVTATDLRTSATAPVGLWVTRFQELYSDTNAHTGLAHVEIAGYATAKINGDLEFKGILEAQIVESIAGGTFAWSDNPALAAKFAATRPVISGDGAGVPYAVDYYRGHDPADLAAADLAAVEAWCDELVPDGSGGTQKRFRFNGRLSSQVESWENLATIGAMCRANPYYWGNQIRWWIDKPATPTHLFCDANTTQDDRSGRSSYTRESIDIRQRPSVIECEILHDAADYTSVPVRVTDKTAAIHHIERIDGTGVTNVVQLTQFANYLFDRGRSVRYRCRWDADTSGMDVMPGDVAYVQSDENGRAIGAQVVAVVGSAVTIDRPATLEAGVTYQLAIQTVTASGKSVVVYTVQSSAAVTDSSEGYAVPSGTRLTLTAVPNPTPQTGDCCILAAEGKLDQVRILTVGRSGNHTCSFAGEEYSAASYARDSSAPDVDTEVSITAVNSAKRSWRPLTRQDLLATLPDSQVFDGDASDTISVGGLVFAGNGTTTVTWSIKDAAACGWIRLAGVSYPIQPNAVGTTDRYIYFDPAAADPTILQTTDLLTDLAGEAYYLLCENVAGVPYPRGGILVSLGDVKVDGMDANADNTAAHAGDIFREPSATAPANPQTGWIWPDNSASPTMIKRYDGSQWVVIGVDLQSWLSAVDPTKLDGSHIAPGSITTGALAADSVTAAQILTESLSAICSYIGTLVSGSITGAAITGGIIRTATSGRYVQIDETGIKFFMPGTVGVFGTTANGGSNLVYGTTAGGGSNAIYGAGVLARFYNTDSGVPFDVVCEQASVGDIHLFPRSSDPTTGKPGDIALVNHKLRECLTSAPTWGDL